MGLEEDRLYPSIYLDDDEAFEIWNKDIGIPAERIFRFGKEDNFWEHGSGPCGPCSEIYYDRGAEYGCGKPGCTVGCDCDRYVEVWNIVFSQFNNDGHGHYEELKQKNIDTGMGLERLACVCQNVNSLFDVDTVMNITNKVSELTGAHYGESQKTDVSLRVITDHIRSSTFMICDGILPSNEGRGYVLRRLLRRAAALAAPQLTDCTLARQAQGKPWFPAAPELHFSISHSGGRWVCAFADAPVGLDLQAHRPCRALALARRFFAPEEAEWLRSRGEAAFFDLWCAKESWLKYTGRGLSALPEAIVLAPDGQFPARPDARLQLLPVFDGYSLCVCTKDAARVALREL